MCRIVKIKCSTENCTKPDIYIDIRGGTISIPMGIDFGELKQSLVDNPGMLVSLGKLVDTSTFIGDEEEKLEEWWEELIQPKVEDLSDETTTLSEKPNDYLVVYCDENHKNYFPFYNSKRPRCERKGKTVETNSKKMGS